MTSYREQLSAEIHSCWFFGQFSVRKGTRWTPQRLVWIGLMMVWDEGQTLGSRWEHACEVARDCHQHWKLGTSYSAFIKAWGQKATTIFLTLVQRFQRQMQEQAGKHWHCNGWLAFAVDGTRIEAPHVAANEEGLGCAGRDKTAPQVFLTLLMHLGMGLPWAYRVGPGTDSERIHMRELR